MTEKSSSEDLSTDSFDLVFHNFFQIPRDIESFAHSIDTKKLVEKVQYSPNPENFEIYMKSFSVEERAIYQGKLVDEISSKFPRITAPIQFIYHGVGESDWFKAIQNWLTWNMKDSFHSAEYNSQSNILKVVITTVDLQKYRLRNEENVRRSIRDYIKTSNLVIKHVSQTPFELNGPHKFLRYDESCEL